MNYLEICMIYHFLLMKISKILDKGIEIVINMLKHLLGPREIK